MDTASRSLDTAKSLSWRTPYGKPGAVRMDRRKWTGSMPRKNYGPAQFPPGS